MKLSVVAQRGVCPTRSPAPRVRPRQLGCQLEVLVHGLLDATLR